MRIALGLLISGLVHAGCFGLLHRLGDRDPLALSITQGRSSIQLMASLPAMPQPAAEEEPAWYPLLPEDIEEEEAKPPPEPAAKEEEQPGLEPDPIVKNAQAAPTEEPAAATPPKAEPPPEKPPEEAAAAPPRQQATTKIESDPAAKADAPSAASIGSEAFSGAEFDDLPRQAAANPPPPYPHEAYAAGRQGVVLLRVTVSEAGTVATIALEKTSGVAALDKSALDTVRTWRFRPALRGGKPVAMEAIVPIRFTIRATDRAASRRPR